MAKCRIIGRNITSSETQARRRVTKVKFSGERIKRRGLETTEGTLK